MRLKARVKDGRVVGVQLSGDFFLAPPEKIDLLEEALEGFATNDPEAVVEVLEYVIKREGIIVEGFAASDVAQLVEELGENT